MNLLSNAVKFTPAGGFVRVAVQRREEFVDIAVTDSGIGIAPEDVDQLFAPFVQVDRSFARRHEGTGLGLALVAKLVHLHRGSVAVKSTPCEGSCFTITLPLPASDAAADHKREAA